MANLDLVALVVRDYDSAIRCATPPLPRWVTHPRHWHDPKLDANAAGPRLGGHLDGVASGSSIRA